MQSKYLELSHSCPTIRSYTRLPLVWSHTRVPYTGPTFRYHTGVRHTRTTLGSHTWIQHSFRSHTQRAHIWVPNTGPTQRSLTLVPHTAPTLRSHTRVPHLGPTLGSWSHSDLSWNLCGNHKIFLLGAIAGRDSRSWNGAKWILSPRHGIQSKQAFDWTGGHNSICRFSLKRRLFFNVETAFKYETDFKTPRLRWTTNDFCNWSQTSFPIHCFGRIWIFQWLTITANVWDLTFILFFIEYICKIHNTFEYNLCRLTYMVLKMGDFFDGHPWKRVILATDAPPPSSSMSVICDTHFLMLPRICRCGKYRRNLSTTKMQAKHQPNHVFATLNQGGCWVFE